ADGTQFMGDYHLARFAKSPSLSELHSMNLQAAKSAYRKLRALLQGRSADAESAFQDVATISLRLNAHEMTLDDREDLGLLLSLALDRLEDSPGLSAAIGACKAFMGHDDVATFRQELGAALGR